MLSLQTRQELEAKTGEAASLSRQLHGSMEEAKQLEAANTKLQTKVRGRGDWDDGEVPVVFKGEASLCTPLLSISSVVR